MFIKLRMPNTRNVNYCKLLILVLSIITPKQIQATPLADALRELKFSVSDFNPTEKPNIDLLKDIIPRSQRELLNEFKTEYGDNDGSGEEDEAGRLKRIKQLNSSIKISINHDQTDIEQVSLLLEKYNQSNGDDYKLHIFYYMGNEEYKKYSEFDFNRCGAELKELSQQLGSPDIIRDLSYPSVNLPSILVDYQALQAAWKISKGMVEFDCSTTISSQFLLEQFLPDVSWDDQSQTKAIQKYLNFFGFDAGKPDGKFGKKTKLAVTKFQNCLREISNGVLSQDQYEFLVETYQSLSSYKTLSDCTALKRALPRKVLYHLASLEFKAAARSRNIAPITWLQCNFETSRTEMFKFDKDKTSPSNLLLTVGVDFESNTIFSEWKKVLSEALITTGKIEFNRNEKNNQGSFDRVSVDSEINRMNGRIKRTIKFFGNKKLEARVTMLGECSKVSTTVAKF